MQRFALTREIARSRTCEAHARYNARVGRWIGVGFAVITSIGACGRLDLGDATDASVEHSVDPDDCRGSCACPVCLGPQCIASGRDIANNRGETHGIAIDGSDLYWTEFNDLGAKGGSIARGTIRGDPPLVVASGQYLPVAPAVSGALIYWGSNNAMGIHTAPKSGGADQLLFPKAASSQRAAFAVDEQAVYWSSGSAVYMTRTGTDTTLFDQGGFGFTVDESNVYFRTAATIMRATRADHSAVALSPSGGDGNQLAVDADYVYWTTFGDIYKPTGAIHRVAKSGGKATVLADELAGPDSLAVDANHVYFATSKFSNQYFIGKVLRVAKAGGVPEVLASCLSSPISLVTDANNIYFTTGWGVRAMTK